MWGRSSVAGIVLLDARLHSAGSPGTGWLSLIVRKSSFWATGGGKASAACLVMEEGAV